MVSLNCMYYILVFLIFPCVFNAQIDMRAFKFTVKRLAYIVKKSRSFSRFNIGTELCRHKPRYVGNLKRMIKHILAVACAVF